MFSVIIPAHNEESVIARCLSSLLGKSGVDGTKVIVVCNGCTDRTAEIAQTFDGVQVIQIETASKIAALNAGDEACSVFPRVYLDADITCSLHQLATCIGSMKAGHSISAPSSYLDMSRSSWFVKAYFQTWMKLPYYNSGHMVGSGIYILTEAGRSRFAQWPDIIADDAYVRALFTFNEIYVDKRSHFTIFAPLNLTGLIKIRTRARLGNIQVESKYPSMKVLGENGSKELLWQLFKRPHRALHWLTYVVVQLVVVRRCNGQVKAKEFSGWERDDSARSL